MSKYNAIVAQFQNKANGAIVALACIPVKPRLGSFPLRLEMALRRTTITGMYLSHTEVEPGRFVLDMPKVEAALAAGLDMNQQDGNNYILGMSPAYEDVEWTDEPRPLDELETAEFHWHDGKLLSAGITCALMRTARSALPVEAGGALTGEEGGAVNVMPYMHIMGWAHPEGMAAWTLALLRSLSDLPHDAHNAAARRVVGQHMKEASEDQQRRAAGLLAHAICTTLRAWNVDGLNPQEVCGVRDEMLFLDAAFCELLERLGECGAALAGELRPARREALNNATKPHEAWGLWLKYDAEDRAWQTNFLPVLASSLWFDVVREEFGREVQLDEAAPLANRLRVVREGGALYSQMSKVGGATAWGWGGTGDENSPLLEGFSVVPGLVRYLPHGAQLIPDARRPAHTQIPVGLEGVGLLLPNRGNRFVLTPTEGMLLLLVFATSQGARTDLGKLTRALNKGKARIQARDHERTAEALHTLRGLRLALPDKTDITLFSVRAPVMDGGPYEDREVSWCATDHLKQLQRGALPGAEALRLLNGSFIFNLSKVLEFGDKEAAHLRAYMYACAMWNDASCNPDKILAHTLEQWAAATNQLSPAAVEYLASERKEGSRVQLSKDKAAAWKVLEDLAARGMLIIDGNKRSFKPLPTSDHVAAFKKYHANQADTLAFLGLNIDGC